MYSITWNLWPGWERTTSQSQPVLLADTMFVSFKQKTKICNRKIPAWSYCHFMLPFSIIIEHLSQSSWMKPVVRNQMNLVIQKSYFVLPLIRMRHNISEMSEEEVKKFQDSSIRRFLDPLKWTTCIHKVTYQSFCLRPLLVLASFLLLHQV